MSVVSGVALPCFITMRMVCRAGYTLRWDLCFGQGSNESSHVVRCQGKFLVGCDGGRSNVRCGARIRWLLDPLGSGWDDYTLKRKVFDIVWWWFPWRPHPSEFIPNSFLRGRGYSHLTNGCDMSQLRFEKLKLPTHRLVYFEYLRRCFFLKRHPVFVNSNDGPPLPPCVWTRSLSLRLTSHNTSVSKYLQTPNPR